jgi:hypothetical protein
MADLTFNANLRFLAEAFTEIFPVSVDVYPQLIWKGAPLVIDQNVDSTGVITADGVTAVDGDVFVGIAAHQVTVNAGDLSEPKVEAYVWPSIVGFQDANLLLADLGKPVWMSDTGTLTLTPGAYPRIGTLFKVENGYAYVVISGPAVLDVP